MSIDQTKQNYTQNTDVSGAAKEIWSREMAPTIMIEIDLPSGDPHSRANQLWKSHKDFLAGRDPEKQNPTAFACLLSASFHVRDVESQILFPYHRDPSGSIAIALVVPCHSNLLFVACTLSSDRRPGCSLSYINSIDVVLTFDQFKYLDSGWRVRGNGIRLLTPVS